MTPRQRTIVIAATVVVALTRLLAISRTPWEWDEMQFMTALREYDVRDHSPHPPGFPMFIAAGKIVALLGVPEFHALQIVVVLGAMALFPLTFLLARALGFDFGVALGGALLFAFAPNVWFYGGTAFSDVAGLAVLLGACVLLLRGHPLPGALLLGLAVGFRPQALLVGIVPLVLAAGQEARRRRARTPALLLLVIAACYVGAGMASGSVREFFDAMRVQQEYVARVDSFQNPERPSLLSLTRTFFKPVRGGEPFDKLASVLALAGGAIVLWRRYRPGLLLALMFLPLNLFTWLMLDVNASSRYAVSYAAMYAILVAYAVPARAFVVPVFLIAFAWSAWPALEEVRTQASPPVAAMRWIVEHVRPGEKIAAVEQLNRFARYYLVRYDVGTTGAFLVTDHVSAAPCAVHFVRPRAPLRHIAGERYYEASVTPLGGCRPGQ